MLLENWVITRISPGYVCHRNFFPIKLKRFKAGMPNWWSHEGVMGHICVFTWAAHVYSVLCVAADGLHVWQAWFEEHNIKVFEFLIDSPQKKSICDQCMCVDIFVTLIPVHSKVPLLWTSSYYECKIVS